MVKIRIVTSYGSGSASNLEFETETQHINTNKPGVLKYQWGSLPGSHGVGRG